MDKARRVAARQLGVAPRHGGSIAWGLQEEAAAATAEGRRERLVRSAGAMMKK